MTNNVKVYCKGYPLTLFTIYHTAIAIVCDDGHTVFWHRSERLAFIYRKFNPARFEKGHADLNRLNRPLPTISPGYSDVSVIEEL